VKRSIYFVLIIFLTSFMLMGCSREDVNRLIEIVTNKGAEQTDDFTYNVTTYSFNEKVSTTVNEVSYMPELSTVCVDMTISDDFYREAAYALRLGSSNNPDDLKGTKDQIFDLSKSEVTLNFCFNELTRGDNYIHLLREAGYNTYAYVLFTVHFDDKDYDNRSRLTKFSMQESNIEADNPSTLFIDFMTEGDQEAIGTLKLKVYNKNTNEKVHEKEFTKEDLVFEDGVGRLSNYKIENLTPGLEYHVAMLFSPPSNMDEVILLLARDMFLDPIDSYHNVLERESIIDFNYSSFNDHIDFDFKLDGDLEDFEFEELILIFKDYHTNEIVKEFEFNDVVFNGSLDKLAGLDDYTVYLRAKYNYKTVYSDQLIGLGGIDKEPNKVGENDYRVIHVSERFVVNTLYRGDIDVFEMKVNEPGLYAFDNESGTSSIKIYDQSYNYLGYFNELQLAPGVYYVGIESFVAGEHGYTLKSLVDDNQGKTFVNLVDGENQFQAFLDFNKDDETFEFTLDQDKIITLSLNSYQKYRILDADGNYFDSDIFEHNNWDDYTYIFPKGTYTLNVQGNVGLVDFIAIVADISSDVYSNDYTRDKNFGELIKGVNPIQLDFKGDQDIYYVDIPEKGNYVFEGEDIQINKIDDSGDLYPIALSKLYELDAGRHYFAFSNIYNLQKTSVDVEFNLAIDENDENQHKIITIGEQVTTKINNSMDKDYFDFTISESGLYKIDINSYASYVKYDIFDEENNQIVHYINYDKTITLNEGNYTIVLYQQKIGGDMLRNATLTITKN
jgi:hypothetical protein